MPKERLFWTMARKHAGAPREPALAIRQDVLEDIAFLLAERDGESPRFPEVMDAYTEAIRWAIEASVHEVLDELAGWARHGGTSDLAADTCYRARQSLRQHDEAMARVGADLL